MKRICLLPALLAGLLLSQPVLSADSDETVPISKARLRELERKEAELEKLKQHDPVTGQPQPPKEPESKPAAVEHSPAVKPAPPSLQPKRSSGPQVLVLPPLKEGEIVEAADLATHYQIDPQAAARRYEKRKLTLHGELADFEKPVFVRNYKLVLKTAAPAIRIECEILPPDKYKAVIKTKEGTELTGILANDAQVTLFRLGESVLLRGHCREFRDRRIRLSSCAVLQKQ